MTEFEPCDDKILEMLSDDVVKQILTVTDQQAMSAQAIEPYCDASLATIYRRLEELQEIRLVREKTEFQRDGNHYRKFESNLERLFISLDDGDLEIDINRCDDAPDRFRTVWDAMQPR